MSPGDELHLTSVMNTQNELHIRRMNSIPMLEIAVRVRANGKMNSSEKIVVDIEAAKVLFGKLGAFLHQFDAH
jgi:hypothetical protein